MYIDWYKIAFSRFERPLLAVVGWQADDVDSFAEGWLFHPDGNTPAQHISLRAAPGKEGVLLAAVLDSFTFYGMVLAKTDPHAVDFVVLESAGNADNDIIAWRTGDLYKSISFAQDRAKHQQLSVELDRLKAIDVTRHV